MKVCALRAACKEAEVRHQTLSNVLGRDSSSKTSCSLLVLTGARLRRPWPGLHLQVVPGLCFQAVHTHGHAQVVSHLAAWPCQVRASMSLCRVIDCMRGCGLLSREGSQQVRWGVGVLLAVRFCTSWWMSKLSRPCFRWSLVAPRLSAKADLLRPTAAMCMLEASLPFGQPHCASSPDVSLIMHRYRAKLGERFILRPGKLFHVKNHRLVADHASQPMASMCHCHEGRDAMASMQRSRGAAPYPF